MKFSTDVTKTDRKTVFVSNFYGVDLRRNESLNRADGVRNLIEKNGKIVKRNGWIEKYRFDSSIDYLDEVAINGTKYVFVYSGKRFYLIDGDKKIDVTESAQSEYRIDRQNLISRALTIIERNGYYYVFGAGEYMALGDFGSGIELRSVKKFAYIPTTTIGIMPEGESAYVIDNTLDETSRGIWYEKKNGCYEKIVLNDNLTWDSSKVYYKRVSTYSLPPTELESENILSPYRKNTMIGASGYAYFNLDQSDIPFDVNNKVIVKAYENGDVNVYRLRERANYYMARYIEKGDDLKGKTITVKSSGSTIVNVSGLQSGISQKGKILFKGENIECRWCTFGITELAWNNARLNLTYYDENDELKTETIATASRKSLYASYTVSFNEKSIKLSPNKSNVITESCVHGQCDQYISAVLTAYITPLQDQNGQDWGSIDHKNGRIFLRKSSVSKDGSDNIEVTFRSSKNVYDTNAIDLCYIASEFGVDGNTDRVFVCGNPQYKNCDFASESQDMTYFPIDHVYKFGLDNTAIIGYARLSDDSQAIFKQSSINESNVYVRKGKWVSRTVRIGENAFTYDKAVFALTGNYLSNSVLAHKTVSYIDGEPIYLTENGVYSLKSSTDVLNERRFSVSRGACVNSDILSKIDRVHNAVNYDGDYYLSVGDSVYVAKSNGYFYENGNKEYNWWIWDNVPAYCLAIIGSYLWFGTEDGRICVFGSSYSDVSYDPIQKGSILFESDVETVAFSENLLLNKGDKILIDQKVYSTLFDNVAVVDGRIKVDDVSTIGKYSVYADKIGDSGLSVDVEYEIAEIDYKDNSFTLTRNGEKVPINQGNFRLSLLLKGKPITVDKLRYSLDSSKNDLCSFRVYDKKVIPNNYNERAIPEGVKGKIIRAKPVVSVWKSAKTHLNYPTMLKTIHKLGVTLGEATAGEIKLMCESKSMTIQNFDFGGGIDFFDPSLTGFSFNGQSNKECYAVMRMKNVGYLDIVIVSQDDKPFELKGFSIEYSVTKGKRGIY